jgi:Zn-dependent peptidase ImmA (M78 family)/transcriptional regulator with XRE-family HTH domain
MINGINPEMVILARESRELNQTELASAIGVQQGTISKIEAGVLPVSDDVLQRFCDALNYPSDFFIQADRIYGFNSSVFFHRKRQALPDRTLRKLHAMMNITRMRVSRLIRSASLPICKFTRMEPSEYDGKAETISKLVRSTWQLPMGPVRNVTRAIEEAGGVVVHFDFGTRHADAISEWVDGYPPIVLVNGNADTSGDRLRLTLAHELGHLIMHRFPTPDMEDEANSFAAEFMMPRREIKPSLYGMTMPKLMDLKLEWGMSMAALVQRGYDLKTLTDAQRRYMFINFGKKGWRMREPVEIPIEKSSLLNQLLNAHMNELGYSHGDMSKLLFIRKESDFREAYIDKPGLRLVG